MSSIPHPPRRERGFTLVEVLTVVTIIAVLAAIGIPAYNTQKLKAARAAAKVALSDVASKMEQSFLNNRQYPNTMADLGWSWTDSTKAHYTTEDGNYEFTINLPAANTWELTATPFAGIVLKDTDCTAFTLTSNGTKTATGKLGNDCWQ